MLIPRSCRCLTSSSLQHAKRKSYSSFHISHTCTPFTICSPRPQKKSRHSVPTIHDVHTKRFMGSFSRRRPDVQDRVRPCTTTSVAFEDRILLQPNGCGSNRPYSQPGLASVDETWRPGTYPCSTQELKDLVDFWPVDDTPAADLMEPTPPPTEDVVPTQTLVDEEPVFVGEEARQTIAQIHHLLNDEEASHDHLYELYRSLPEPRAKQMAYRTFHRLLSHLSRVPHPTEPAMLRFLSIIDDAKVANRRLKLSHWNSAIFFVGTVFQRVSGSQLEHALSIWRGMEGEAGIKANHVTFNILFDTATKSGKYLLADMIYEEMQSRGIKYTRYFRTSLIYHHGLRRDGDAVRRTYADLISAGEIVDTAVINCVIVAFLNCGEATTAEQTFERMKQLHAAKTNQPPPPPSHWRDKKELGRHFARVSESRRSSYRSRPRQECALDGPFSPNIVADSTDNTYQPDSSHATLAGGLADVAIEDEETSIAPDLQTYRALIHYHAVTAGDIDRVASLVDEMEHYGVDLHGSMFLDLFRAFGHHGGILYTQWTVRRLINTFTSFIAAVDADQGAGLVYVSRPAAIIATKAFLKCTDVVRASKAWVEMRQRILDVSPEELQDIDQEIAPSMGENVQVYWDVLRWAGVEVPEPQEDPDFEEELQGQTSGSPQSSASYTPYEEKPMSRAEVLENPSRLGDVEFMEDYTDTTRISEDAADAEVKDEGNEQSRIRSKDPFLDVR